MDTTTSRDLSRKVATGGDMDYTLSLEEVDQRYAEAGHPRTLRTLQRYCASGHLEAQKMATTLGDKYLVTPQSVARHIAQIEELASVDPVATSVAHEQSQKNDDQPLATGDDKARQAATGEEESSRHVAQLEKRIEEKDVMITVLRGELGHRNDEIIRRNERERETNIFRQFVKSASSKHSPANNNTSAS